MLLQRPWGESSAVRWTVVETDRQTDRLLLAATQDADIPPHPLPKYLCSPHPVILSRLTSYLVSKLTLIPYRLSLSSNLGLCDDNYYN